MLVPMARVDVVAPARLAARAVRSIHRCGFVHLVEFAPPPGVGAATFVRPDAPLAGRFDGEAARLDDLAALLAAAGQPEPDPDGRVGARVAELWGLDDETLAERIRAVEPVRAAAAALTDERVRLGGRIARLTSYRRLIGGLAGVMGRLPSVQGYGSTGIVLLARYRPLVPLIRAELERLTDGRCEIVAADIDAERIGAVLLYPLRQAAEVRSLLGGRDLEEVTLPDEFAGVPFEELGPRLGAAIEEAGAARDRAGRDLAELRRRSAREIAALRRVVADRIAEDRALQAAGRSDHLVVVSGWVPATRVGELRDRLRAEVGPEVVVADRPPTAAEAAAAPVAFDNRRWARAFEALAAFAVVPRYGSLDPTPLLALTFPAFVGLMVGDVGYGLVLLAILGLLRVARPASPAVRRLLPIGLVAAVSTIAFGFLFGEWFGDAGKHLFGMEPLWLDRADAVRELLVLALAIGVGQVTLGLVLGAVNSALLRHRRETAGRVALLVALVAVLVVLAALARLVPAEVGAVAGAGGAIALVLLVLALGLSGPIELVGALGNILSYARLMAIGLAAVMLALTANRLGGLLEGTLLGLLVAGLVHALNFALGFFDASIQGIRLHYVEFFTKFVEPGGVRYRPFVSAIDRPAAAGATVGGT